MKLGILVNTDSHLDAVIGIADAAIGKGHDVIIFAMDAGTRLLAQPSYAALSARPGVSMSYCDHSAQQLGVGTAGVRKEIVSGSQYDNATMVHEADKVIVL